MGISDKEEGLCINTHEILTQGKEMQRAEPELRVSREMVLIIFWWYCSGAGHSLGTPQDRSWRAHG